MTYDERIRAEAGGAEQAARAFGLAAFGQGAAPGVAPVAGATAEAAEAGGGAAVLAGLKAVRVERLARAVEALAVRAAAFDESKHPRGTGGKWTGKAGGTEQGTAHADPPGGPSGRIRHAVLVMDGKRYRGPSHFQALQEFEQRGGTYEGKGTYAEGFETESGHFLDREQAARYVSHSELTPSGVKRLERLPTGKQWLAAQDVALKSVDGQLYTQDAVMAADGDPWNLREHSSARDDAERTYRRTVDAAVSALAVEALAEAARKEKDEKAKKRRREELFAALALLLFGASVTIYRALRQRLAKTIPGQTPEAAVPTSAVPALTPGGSGTAGGLVTPSPTGQNAPKPTLGPIAMRIEVVQEEAEAFARGREDLVADFPRKVLEALDRTAVEAEAEGLDVAGAVHNRADQAAEGQGRVVSETEAQAAYGSAMIRTLREAGFRTKIWQTMEDERVRPSHVECGNQGPVPMDKPFANGLQYPGDPNGGAAECANCRCWLVGGQRSVVTASDPDFEQKHQRGPGGKWTGNKTLLHEDRSLWGSRYLHINDSGVPWRVRIANHSSERQTESPAALHGLAKLKESTGIEFPHEIDWQTEEPEHINYKHINAVIDALKRKVEEEGEMFQVIGPANKPKLFNLVEGKLVEEDLGIE